MDDDLELSPFYYKFLRSLTHNYYYISFNFSPCNNFFEAWKFNHSFVSCVFHFGGLISSMIFSVEFDMRLIENINKIYFEVFF